MSVPGIYYTVTKSSTFLHSLCPTLCSACHRPTCTRVSRPLTWADKHECTGRPRKNGADFGRVFLRSNYTDIAPNTYIQTSMVTEILAREKCGLLWCLRSILCPWRDPLDLHRDNPAVACSSQRRPWLRNRCSECIVAGSQFQLWLVCECFCSSI